MKIVRRNALAEVVISSWKFHEQGSRVAKKLQEVALALSSFPFEKLLCSPLNRLPCIRFPLYHSLSIHYAEDEDLEHVDIIYGSPGARKGIKIPTFNRDRYSAEMLPEAGNPYNAKGSLTFLYGQDEVGFYSKRGKSFLREKNFYAPETPAMLEIFLPPAWEQADFNVAGAITEHIERQEKCLAEIFERSKSA